MNQMTIKLYSILEVCDILQLTRRTVYTYIKEGKLKAVKIGKYWRVTEENLSEFINNGTPIVDGNRRPENQERNKEKS